MIKREGVLLVLLAAANIYWLLIYLNQGADRDSLVLQTDSLRVISASHERRATAFEDVVTRLPIEETPMLRGRDVFSGELTWLEDTPFTLIYILRADCPWSFGNMEALNTLAASPGWSVFAISFEDEQERLSEMPELQNAKFPVLVSPEGEVLRYVPRLGTPLSIVLHEGRITTFLLGTLDDVALAGLRPID